MSMSSRNEGETLRQISHLQKALGYASLCEFLCRTPPLDMLSGGMFGQDVTSGSFPEDLRVIENQWLIAILICFDLSLKRRCPALDEMSSLAQSLFELVALRQSWPTDDE